jgi:hypothetical protein
LLPIICLHIFFLVCRSVLTEAVTRSNQNCYKFTRG